MRDKSKGNSQKSQPQVEIQDSTFCIVVLTFTFFLLSYRLFFPVIAEACPGCKEALFDPSQLPQRLSTAKGYALSIVLLLSVPAALIGGVSLLILRARRRP